MARNRYHASCYVCGFMVKIGTGHFERHGNAWRTKHAVHPGDGRVTCEMAKKENMVASTLSHKEG